MFTQRVALTQQDAREVKDSKLHTLGTIGETADGRIFRYSRNGAVALNAGKINVQPAAVANHTNIAIAASAAVGARRLQVTVGATAVSNGQYDDGYLVINDGPGVGCAYRVEGTSGIASSGTGLILVAESVATALTTSSLACLIRNQFADSVVSPFATGVAQVSNGSNNVAVPAANFYWSQTSGPASVLSDGIIAKGANAIISDSVAGAIETEVAAGIAQRVAYALEATVDAKYYPVFLTIDK